MVVYGVKTEFDNGRTDITPEEARYNPEKLAKVDEIYGRLVDSGRVQAAGYLMARNGKIFAHRMAGRLTHRKDSPEAKTTSIKRVASVSKVFTAGIIMKLVEDGLLWLEQPVKSVLEEFDNPMLGGIKLRHLLTHTSGLAADPGYFSEPYPDGDYDRFDHDDWMKRMLAGPVQSKPGEQWSYCSIGFNLLAEIASRVTGKHFNDLLAEEIFRPLGLNRTFMELPEALTPELMTCADWDLLVTEEARRRKPDRCPNGGNGVYSTMYDLFRYGQCFLNKGELDGVRFLGKTTVEEMTRNQLTGVPAYHWGKQLKDMRQGLGWEYFIDGTTCSPCTYHHEGWGWCSLHIDPSEEIVLVTFVGDYTGWDPEVMVKPRVTAWSGIL